MLKLLLGLSGVVLCLPMGGCVALGAAALVTDVAVSTVGTAIETTGNVAEGAIDLALPDGDDDEDDN